MIISIPNSFFVPVACVDSTLLNLSKDNLIISNEEKREPNNKKQGDKNKEKIKDKNQIYLEIDDEYVNSVIKTEARDKRITKIKEEILKTNENGNIKKVKRE